MSAKEMWFKIKDITKYEETKDVVNIYYAFDEGREPSISFLKNNKEIASNDVIRLEELQAINKQVEELGWLGSDIQ